MKKIKGVVITKISERISEILSIMMNEPTTVMTLVAIVTISEDSDALIVSMS